MAEAQTEHAIYTTRCMSAAALLRPDHVPLLSQIDPQVAPISTALGVLGMPGLTAYVGLRNIGQVRTCHVNCRAFLSLLAVPIFIPLLIWIRFIFV